jgi:hypothetical protein
MTEWGEGGLDVRYGEEECLCYYQESKPSHFAGYSVAAFSKARTYIHMYMHT